MLIGTVIVLSLIVFLLAVPVTLTFQLSWRQTLSADLRLKWAFGLVRADVSPDPAKSGSDKPEAVPRRKSKRSKTNFMAALRQHAFRRRVLRFVSDVWRAIHKQNVRLRVRLGLGRRADQSLPEDDREERGDLRRRVGVSGGHMCGDDLQIVRLHVGSILPYFGFMPPGGFENFFFTCDFTR